MDLLCQRACAYHIVIYFAKLPEGNLNLVCKDDWNITNSSEILQQYTFLLKPRKKNFFNVIAYLHYKCDYNTKFASSGRKILNLIPARVITNT